MFELIVHILYVFKGTYKGKTINEKRKLSNIFE